MRLYWDKEKENGNYYRGLRAKRLQQAKAEAQATSFDKKARSEA